MAKYYIYDFSDYGGSKSIELTEEESKELKADGFGFWKQRTSS